MKKVYSCDDAPWGHLLAKTKYLLKSPPECVYLSIWNKNPREFVKSKHGDKKHMESQTVVEWKTMIREKYNPAPDEHVVHVTDNDIQATYLQNMFDPPSYCYVRDPLIKSLTANILDVGVVPITETPHYQFTQGNEQPYIDYWEKFWGRQLKDNHTPENFRKLIQCSKLQPIDVEGNQIIDGVHRTAIALSRGEERIRAHVTDS